jgi:hypothetical protein
MQVAAYLRQLTSQEGAVFGSLRRQLGQMALALYFTSGVLDEEV